LTRQNIAEKLLICL